MAARIGGQRLPVTKKEATEKLRIIHSRCWRTLPWRMRRNPIVVVVNHSSEVIANIVLAAMLTSKNAVTARLLRLVIHAAQR